MKNVNANKGPLRIHIIDSGNVVINSKEKWVQKFPTEDEAVEFIREVEGETLNEN